MPTKWGGAVYFTNPEIVRVVKRIEPACTGRELLRALVALGYRGVDGMRLIRWLGVLRRLNIISMDEIQQN